MYPLTHLFVAENVFQRMSSEMALGSVFPDVLSSCKIPWKDSHGFAKIIENEDMNLGNLSHGIFLPGLDFYSDTSYHGKKGYAFQQSAPLHEELAELGIPEGHLSWRGHNFIEMAIEVNIGYSYSYLWNYLKLALKNEELLKECSTFILKQNINHPNIIEKVIQRFISLKGMPAFLAEDYAHKLSRYYVKNFDQEKCLKIISHGQEIIKDTYQDFLLECMENIKSNLKNIHI